MLVAVVKGIPLDLWSRLSCDLWESSICGASVQCFCSRIFAIQQRPCTVAFHVTQMLQPLQSRLVAGGCFLTAALVASWA